MKKKEKMSAAELGSLWLTHHKKTMILRMLEYFIETSEEEKAKDLMAGLHKKLHTKVIELETMLKDDGATPPVGFTEKDVNLQAPALYKNGFDIMFSRVLKEISMGMYALHMTITYRDDIMKFYRELTDLTQNYYDYFTQYLREKSLLPRANNTVMPASADYVTDKNYMKGTNFLGEKRILNTVEFGVLYRSVETNIIGMQLMKGFAQSAEDEDARKYFAKGQGLAREILKETQDILLENSIQPSASPGGTVTDSTVPPFSNKLMLFCNYLLAGYSIGGQGFNAAFVLRHDVAVKTGVFAKDVYEYMMEGVKLMMSKGWFEEPPKMAL